MLSHHVFLFVQLSPLRSDTIDPGLWLKSMMHDAIGKNSLNLPKSADGKPYTYHWLSSDQEDIAIVVLRKLHEWMNCKDFSMFEPL